MILGDLFNLGSHISGRSGWFFGFIRGHGHGRSAWNRNELADVTAKFRWRMSTLEQSTMVYWEYSPNSHNLILIYGTGWWIFHNFPLLPRHKSDTYHILTYIPCTTPIQQPRGWHSPGWDGRRSTSGPPFLARLSMPHMPCGCAQGMAEKNEDMKVS